MFLFRVIGWQLYRPQPPSNADKFKCEDVTLIIPTIDTDEEAMHEAMRSWVLNEPYEILIVTVGEDLQKELQQIASTSLAADITRVLYVEKPANKRIQLVHGVCFALLHTFALHLHQPGRGHLQSNRSVFMSAVYHATVFITLQYSMLRRQTVNMVRWQLSTASGACTLVAAVPCHCFTCCASVT